MCLVLHSHLQWDTLLWPLHVISSLSPHLHPGFFWPGSTWNQPPCCFLQASFPGPSLLHPSLSLSVHLSRCLLPPLIVSLYPLPSSESSFLGRAPGSPSLAPRQPPRWEWKQSPGQTGARICRGLRGGGGQVLEGRQPAGYESELNTAPAPPPARARSVMLSTNSPHGSQSKEGH